MLSVLKEVSMAVIVAINGSETAKPEDRLDFTVLSVTPGVDSGYVMEYIRYGDGTTYELEHTRASSPYDFKIGRCHFIKDDGVWYFVQADDRYKVVYGADVLDAYGSGEMFKQLFHLFPAD